MNTNEKIRYLRWILGYSQEYMADCIGVSQSTYSKYEHGNIKLTIEKANTILSIINSGLTEKEITNVEILLTHLHTGAIH